MTTTIKKQILINARSLFTDPDTWIRGFVHNKPNTAWCLLGVLNEAARRMGIGELDEPNHQAYCAVSDVISKRCTPSVAFTHSLVTYNDAPETTFNDIQELLDDAISLCDA